MHLINVLRDPVCLAPGQRTELPPAAPRATGWKTARVVTAPPILLGRLPAGTIAFGGESFILNADGAPITETLLGDMRANPALAPPIRPDSVPIDAECIILARYGYQTWGHWLGEIVPQAALVERSRPGHWRYAIPGGAPRVYTRPLLESLAFYGITEDRLITLDPAKQHVFGRASVVTPIWSDYAPHPAAIDAMRLGNPTGHRKVAITRRSGTRAMLNAADVENVLVEHGYVLADVSVMPFPAQVELFSSAHTIFSVLGSGLTGLIYAPDQCRVIVARPEQWHDRFFYALTQLRRGTWHEVAGPSAWDGKGHYRNAPFTVPIDLLRDVI